MPLSPGRAKHVLGRAYLKEVAGEQGGQLWGHQRIYSCILHLGCFSLSQRKGTEC